MKILLVAPTFKYREKALLSMSDFPAGIAYIAAALKEAGHTVVGLNPNNDIRFNSTFFMLTNKLHEVLERERPDLIGLGGIVTDYHFLKDAIEVCRKFSKAPIVLGGGIISNDREWIFENLHPDYGIVGEGEETTVALAKVLEQGHGIVDIPNLSHWHEGKAVHNPISHDYRTVDERPMPDYSVFNVDDMLDNYSMATRLLYRYCRTDPRPFTIVTARGCPFNCTFCVHRSGAKYRARSIPNIMEEIRMNYERYHFNILIILDELFAVNKQRMKEFCDAVLVGKDKYGWDFNWMFQTHASAALDLETLQLAKKAGCFFFSYGLESASPTVLKSMNKKIVPEQIAEAIRLAKESHIGFGGNLIFGDIAETQMTIYESLDFFYKHCKSAFMFLGFLMPYPGNKLFDTCMERGIIKDKAAYYANLDHGIPNMTCLPDQIWYQWVNFISLTERSWLWVEGTDAIKMEKEEYSDAVTNAHQTQMYRMEAKCPYCGADIVYREMIGRQSPDWPIFLGTGCTNCNQRVKINFKVPVSAEKKELEKKELVIA